MSISNDELSFLILRYFKESGFNHSHFTYINESNIDTTSINGSQIPPGALITLLQKGLLYIQLERQILNGGKGSEQGFGSQITLLNAALREGTALGPKDTKKVVDDSVSASIPLDQNNSITLSEHIYDAICCCWSKDSRFLATGSSDNSAIIWDLSNIQSVSQCKLQHGEADSKQGAHQVNTLDWSPDGKYLVTGCSDGSVRLFDHNGSLIHSIQGKERIIHAVRFDPSGQRFIVGDSLSKLRVCAAQNGQKIKSIKLNHEAIHDAAWKNEISFAVGCYDGVVAVFDSIEAEPVILTGHTLIVNSVAWDLQDNGILASCSDDSTVRVWKNNQEQYVLSGHRFAVYAIKWSINGLLASSSMDCTVRIWDPNTGNCLHVLQQHQKLIYALSFSPCGRYLVSGSNDQTIKFWNSSTGELLVSCLGKQNIMDLQYDGTGKYVAACLEGGNVVLLQTESLSI